MTSGSIATITVDLGDRGYPVLVGHGARCELAAVLPDGIKRVAVITQAGIPWSVDPGVDSIRIEIPDGEAAKSLTVVEDVCRQLAVAGFTRADAIVAVGGGVVTDVGGFVAAVYHRGIRFVSVATTLLGQVDAAIGGKTGVNLPEGKNLVGAFWQPSAVICDTETLESLPRREFQCGVGEIAKYHFLGGGRLDELALDERVAACVQIKADVVMNDEREGGKRAILNYGHTLAHAIETAGQYDLRHGEAVAIGIRYAAEVAHRLGRIDAARVAEHERVLSAYELPSTVPDALADDALLALFASDKKAIDGVTFVLDGPAGVEVVVGIDATVLADSFAAVR
ncbi:MAG: 3-dehydroquinate synthase [Acidimicrobiales bacterium]|nr:3-dehydroquinate synthase [Acidimicrobiales bacterium]MDG1876865.1 3-dehydroquinate synthase [Acidimicrobiales bacterium]